MSGGRNIQSIDGVIYQIKNQLHKEGVMDRIYRSAEGISSVFQQIMDGQSPTSLPSLSPAHLAQLQQWAARRPSPSSPSSPSSSHQGGANTNTSANTKNTNTSVKNTTPQGTAASLMGISTENYAQMKQSLGSEPYDPKHASGVDEAYMAAVNKINEINERMNQFASRYGILKLEKESDLETDFRLIPDPVTSLIASGVSQVGIPAADTKAFLDKIKIPFRLIVTGIYLFLDVTRVLVSLQGEESKRQTLTLLVALFEFLRGDWQKALLSFMGYYGEAPLMFGQFAKIYLTMFRTLSPTLQQQITFGALDVTKSFLIGMLLAIFKVAAPEEVRLPLITVLRQIAEKKAAIDGTLATAGLPPREGYFSPTFEDLNHLQSLMDDPDFVCSCEYAELIKQVDRSPLIHIVLELMRIEVNPEHRARYRCPAPCKPFVASLVSTGLQQTAAENVPKAAENSKNVPVKVPENVPKVAENSKNVPVKVPENVPVKVPENAVEKEIQAQTGGGRVYVPRAIRLHATIRRKGSKGLLTRRRR